VVEFGGKEILRVPLKGPHLTIGRDATADVHLDNRALSRRHAQIEKRGAAIWIRDLGSQNGTFVNGQRITDPQALQGGDTIELGRYKLMIEGADEAGDETPVLTLTGPEGKHRFAMVGDEIIIGRAPSCDIAIGHKSISRRHLRVALDGEGFIAEDLGSQNGTRLYGKKLTGPTPFKAGDKLVVSEFQIELGYLSQVNKKQGGDRANKTMMIDRSELAKAAYVEGDFEKMKSQAGRFDKPGTDRFQSGENTGEHDALPANGAPQAEPPPSKRPPRLSLTHPDVGDQDVKLTQDVTVVAEDGRLGDHTDGRSYADQGYLIVVRTASGVVVSVAGDRRLVTVNGKPRLSAALAEGDTVEFGLLTAVFHE
jgi:pSer/pThr/pTyr-binding forkhead associated (FHA) protein